MSATSPEPTPSDQLDADIDPIRVESLSTRMPVHQLAKGGEEEIRIIERKLDGGQVSLYWKVEPNLTVGRPGQLAYHLDTLVIKRRLDQLRRPLQRLIRIGDLRQIARELNHGGDTTAIKRAFEQNASVFIRAKVAYRTREGQQVNVEGYFNRYNVFFRGQGLPGGGMAETVYISLNDPYYGMLNNTDWRPLDYEYLKSLAPAAQRFYELVSPRIFATLINRRPHAWVRYSEYCRYAVQKRQLTRRRMQIQMAAIHRPHLKSGYLSRVSYRTTPSEEGSADWFIHYVPGPRAHAEHRAFNQTPGGLTKARRASRDGLTPPGPELLQEGPPTRNSTIPETSPAGELVRRFYLNRHQAEPRHPTPTQLKRAEDVLTAAGGDLAIANLAVDLAAEEGRRQPRGYPSHIGGVLEGAYVDRARKALEAHNASRDASARQARDKARRASYEAWCRRRAQERIVALSEPERERLLAEESPVITHQYRYYLARQPWTEERIRDWVVGKILTNYGRQGEPTFEEWSAAQDAAQTPPAAPGPPLQ